MIEDVSREYFAGNTLTRDFFDLVCGDRLGFGMSRQVFACKIDPALVIKMETTSHCFQNVMEWDVWNRVRYVKGIAAWFAPCESISACGTILVQKRCLDVTAPDLPDRVPRLFSDLKVDNWGRMGKRIVCRDYGSNLVFENGIGIATKKAKWK